MKKQKKATTFAPTSGSARRVRGEKAACSEATRRSAGRWSALLKRLERNRKVLIGFRQKLDQEDLSRMSMFTCGQIAAFDSVLSWMNEAQTSVARNNAIRDRRRISS
jgi:hypothetical protein